MHASPPRSSALAKAPEDGGWRRRTLTVFGLLVGGPLAVGALKLDWSEGAAMALGQLAGMVAPLAMLGAVLWGVASLIGRRA